MITNKKSRSRWCQSKWVQRYADLCETRQQQFSSSDLFEVHEMTIFALFEKWS